MIKKLQTKFVIIIMSMMTVTFFCILAAVNYTMYRTTEGQTMEMMRHVASSDGVMRGKGGKLGAKPQNDEPPPVPQTNFCVKLDENGAVTELITDRNQVYTEDEINEYLQRALASGKKSGALDTLKFLITDRPYGSIAVFFDNSLQISAAVRLFWVTFFAGGASLIVIFFIALYLSGRAIKPVKEAYEAQKRFVADASHELKTPLTVISANADVLSGELGENKWLSFIKAEAQRMGGLVNNLLYLAKTDASESAFETEKFSLSDAVISAVLPFESVCYEKNKKLTLSVEENISFKGDERKLSQVTAILMDNAVKNADDGGEIKVTLCEQGGRRLLTVYNTGAGIAPESLTKIFDRFYRADDSRERETGGFGLGLSIAKTIVEAHKGKIWAESEQGKSARFIVAL